MKKDVHVMPEGKNWTVNMEDTKKRFTTQSEAEFYGRELAREKKVEFFLHGEDGQIRLKDSYGNDPRNIPG